MGGGGLHWELWELVATARVHIVLCIGYVKFLLLYVPYFLAIRLR